MKRNVSNILHQRPSEGLVVACHFLLAPSGLIPGAGEGGRRWSLVYSGGMKDPIALLIYVLGSLL
jgi:hypothetical protein